MSIFHTDVISFFQEQKSFKIDSKFSLIVHLTIGRRNDERKNCSLKNHENDAMSVWPVENDNKFVNFI